MTFSASTKLIYIRFVLNKIKFDNHYFPRELSILFRCSNLIESKKSNSSSSNIFLPASSFLILYIMLSTFYSWFILLFKKNFDLLICQLSFIFLIFFSFCFLFICHFIFLAFWIKPLIHLSFFCGFNGINISWNGYLSEL